MNLTLFFLHSLYSKERQRDSIHLYLLFFIRLLRKKSFTSLSLAHLLSLFRQTPKQVSSLLYFYAFYCFANMSMITSFTPDFRTHFESFRRLWVQRYKQNSIPQNVFQKTFQTYPKNVPLRKASSLAKVFQVFSIPLQKSPGTKAQKFTTKSCNPLYSQPAQPGTGKLQDRNQGIAGHFIPSRRNPA